MRSMEQLSRIYLQLESAGRLSEILDADGKIEPTDAAWKKVTKEYPQPRRALADEAERFRLAQSQTLLDLENKYQSELN